MAISLSPVRIKGAETSAHCYIPITDILSAREKVLSKNAKLPIRRPIPQHNVLDLLLIKSRRKRKIRRVRGDHGKLPETPRALPEQGPSAAKRPSSDQKLQTRRSGKTKNEKTTKKTQEVTHYAKREFPHLTAQFYANVQEEIKPEEHEPLTPDSLVGKIIFQRYEHILKNYKEEPPRYIRGFVGGVHNDKSISGIWLPDGQYIIVKTGSDQEIMRELRGNTFMKQYAIGNHLPVIRFNHTDPLLDGSHVAIPEGKGYLIIDWITDYESFRDIEKSIQTKPKDAIAFVKEYAELNSEMWDKNERYVNIEPDLNNADFYSMQRIEWDDVKKTTKHNLERLAKVLLGSEKVTEEQLLKLKQAKIRVKVRDTHGKGFHWEEKASYADIEKRIDVANKENITCMVAGNNDTSFKNVLKDKPFSLKRKLLYYFSKFKDLRNYWVIDTEMVGLTDLAENFAVMGKGKSPTMADEKASRVRRVNYNSTENTIDIDYLSIKYSRAALAVENFVLHTLVPFYAKRYEVDPDKLKRDYLMRRANNEIHAMAHLSSKRDPMMILLHLYEAGNWIEHHEKATEDSTYFAKII